MNETNKDIFEKSYAPLNITKKTIEGISKHPEFFRGHVKTFSGKIYTTSAFKKKSDDVLGRRMP